MMSIPTLLMSLVGLLIAIFRMQDRDIPFLAWLIVIGGTIVFVIGHTEARYLLPAVPAILYFAIRGLEAAAATLNLLAMAAARAVRRRRVGFPGQRPLGRRGPGDP